jgi:hypothetical protein
VSSLVSEQGVSRPGLSGSLQVISQAGSTAAGEGGGARTGKDWVMEMGMVR